MHRNDKHGTFMEAITFDPLVSRVASIPGNMRLSSLSGLQLFPNWTAQEQDIMMTLEEMD